MSKDLIMLEFYQTNIHTQTDPAERKIYQKLINKHERKLGLPLTVWEKEKAVNE